MTKEKGEKMFRRYAAVDVGSNAVRLLIKRFEKNGSDIYSCKEQLVRVPLRLGFDVFRKNKISREKEKDLTRLMRSFTYLMKIYGVKEYMACATSALRDAKNGKDVVKRVKEKTGIRIQILNGQEEAKGIFYNNSSAMSGNCMYVDVGGGSTEVTIVSDGDMVYSRSFNIGTIRMLCGAVSEREWKSLTDDIHELCGLYTNIKVIGSGGNINKIYRLIDSRDRQHKRITVKSLIELYNDLNDMSVEERVRNYGLRYDRADVIVPAASIFMKIAELLGTKFIYVPTIGLSDGMINTMFEQRLKKYGNGLAGGDAEGNKGNDEDLSSVDDSSSHLSSDSIAEEKECNHDKNLCSEKQSGSEKQGNSDNNTIESMPVEKQNDDPAGSVDCSK